MRIPVSLKTFLWCTIFFNSLPAFSQNSIPDSSTENTSIQNAINVYHRFLFPETNLYNGSEYAFKAYYPLLINEGDPFFISNQYANGSVFYNNILYENVRMLYDVIKGELLINDPTKIYIIKLNTDNIGWFIIYGHTFIKVTEDSAGSSSVHTGFYDVLYNGNTSLYKKVSKEIREKSGATEIWRSVVESGEYFIKKDSHYYVIRNKRDLRSLLIDKKKEIDQFAKRNGLSLRKLKDDTLIKVMAYYNSINNQKPKANS